MSVFLIQLSKSIRRSITFSLKTFNFRGSFKMWPKTSIWLKCVENCRVKIHKQMEQCNINIHYTGHCLLCFEHIFRILHWCEVVRSKRCCCFGSKGKHWKVDKQINHFGHGLRCWSDSSFSTYFICNFFRLFSSLVVFNFSTGFGTV